MLYTTNDRLKYVDNNNAKILVCLSVIDILICFAYTKDGLNYFTLEKSLINAIFFKFFSCILIVSWMVLYIKSYGLLYDSIFQHIQSTVGIRETKVGVSRVRPVTRAILRLFLSWDSNICWMNKNYSKTFLVVKTDSFLQLSRWP